MLIRKLTQTEAGLFRQFRAEMCAHHPEAFGQTPEEVRAMPDDKFLEWMGPSDDFPQKFVFSAWDGDQLLGTAGLHRDDGAKDRHRGYIWTVYVRPDARGKGISKLLMQRLIDEARTIDGVELLVLDVALPQVAARALYRSLGFRVVGLHYHSYKLEERYVDHEEMVLEL